MTRKHPLLLAAALLFFVLQVSAQKSGLINSGELLVQSVKLNQDDKHKDAIALLQKVSRSDTNYNKVLYELSYSAYLDSNFELSRKYAEEGLKRFPHESTNWYNLLANACDDMGEHEKAIGYYDKLIAENKNSAQGHFNKGVTLYRLKKYDEAKKCFQQCVLVDPFYVSAHYFLGTLAMEEGRVPEAMMSYATNLLLNPGNRYTSRVVQAFSSLAKMTDEATAKAAKRKSSRTDDFDMVQEIIVSKISLDKKYKLKASLEDPIVRQLQVLCEKVEFNAADKGFWMQYYVPFFSRLLADDHFEPFVYHIFGELEIKSINTWLSKNKKDVAAFKEMADNYFTAIRSTQTLEFNKREGVKQQYHYSDYLIGKGEARQNGKDLVLVGPWEFYHKNGKLKSKGSYNDNYDRIGTWEYYFDNGQLKERTTYANDKPEGKSQGWFDNGIMSVEGMYKNGEQEGEWKYFYYSGLPSKTVPFKAGKVNGKVTGYTISSDLSYIAHYVDDKEQGELVYYYMNGKVKNSTVYTAGEANGKYREYYYNGQLKTEGNFAAGKKTGLWKQYHQNGKLSEESNYNEGELEGDQKVYYDNGQLMNTFFYKKGKVEGLATDFDDDGKKFCETIYEKGRLKDIKFFDKTGKVISNATSRNGSGNLTFFDPVGNKTSEGYFTKEGLREGKTTYYYRTGKPSVVAEFKGGYLNGKRVSYFKNGKISEDCNYKDDSRDGYYISNYVDGTPESEGWVVEGDKQGEHIDYNQLGNVTSKSFFVNDDENGYVEYYHPNGKIDYEQRFEEGWLREINQFDTTGKVVCSVTLPQGNGDFQFKLYNGKTYINGSYRNNKLHGEYKVYYPNEKLSNVQYYRWGYRDSTYTAYHLNGKVYLEGKYRLGNKHGKWNYYYDNGKLQQTENYVDGSEEDKFTMYNEDGTLDKEGNYKGNELDGPYRIYGDNNLLAIQLNYKGGKLVSYTYEGKDGKLVPDIAIKNGTAMLTAYYKNGNKSAEMNYVDDEQNGVRRLYLSNGKIFVDGTRVDGYEHGVKKIYHPNSQLEKEENYRYGNLHGVVKAYYPNGKIRSEETYYNGELHGDCKYYDATGKVQVRIYFYGVMQQIK